MGPWWTMGRGRGELADSRWVMCGLGPFVVLLWSLEIPVRLCCVLYKYNFSTTMYTTAPLINITLAYCTSGRHEGSVWHIKR